MKMNEMLNKIMIYQFCAIDLNLFLDNFPKEENAKEDYKKISAKLTELVAEYEKECGPLTNFGSAFFEEPKAWVSEPWPWEKMERED